MISGFNTDIKHQGVTYHIQTEDKGQKDALILSLVYDGGTILASKRTPYDELINGSFDAEELSARLQRQHKLICAAVRAGRIEDLKKMTAKQRRERSKEDKETVSTVAVSNAPIAKPAEVFKNNGNSIQTRPDDLSLDLPVIYSEKPVDNSIPKPIEELIWEIPDTAIEDLIIDDVEILQEAIVLPPEAIEIVDVVPAAIEEVSIAEQPVVADDETEDLVERLTINLHKNIEFHAGHSQSLEIFVNTGRSTKGVGGAHILVKILGSSFRPLIYHGKTDPSGISVLDLKLPNFKQGRAAIIIRAMRDGEEVELRRTLLQS